MNYILTIFSFAFLWGSAVSQSCTTPLGRESKCVSLYECPELLTAFEQRPLPNSVVTFLRMSQCGFDNFVPIVCCGPMPSWQPSDLTTPRPRPTQGPISQTVDRAVDEDSYPAPQGQCGIETNGDRIYGGTITEIDEFPWMALLGYRPVNNGPLTYQCGGVLLNHRYVLSAAHCVVGEIETAVGKLASVRLGEYDLQTDTDCVENDLCADPIQEIAVHSAFAHRGYSDSNTNRKDDISLIRLAKRAVFSDYVAPICLVSPNSRLDVGNSVFVAGWGKTLNGKSSPIKLKLGLPIFNKRECDNKYRTLKAVLTDKQLCAGGSFAEDACKGDSGGPLMRKNSRGNWESIAVVSFGYGCGRDGWPGVYTSVASYLDWIRDNMRNSNV